MKESVISHGFYHINDEQKRNNASNTINITDEGIGNVYIIYFTVWTIRAIAVNMSMPLRTQAANAGYSLKEDLVRENARPKLTRAVNSKRPALCNVTNQVRRQPQRVAKGKVELFLISVFVHLKG